MDKSQEVRNRWRIIFELTNLSDRIKKLQATVSDEEILDDVRFLQERVDELEKDLADALNPVSSRMGALTDLRDGVLYYRLNGMLIPVSAIVEGLKFLMRLRASGGKISKGMEKEQEKMFQIIEQAFGEGL